MELIWNGTDITQYVNITGCIHRDVSGGRSDSLELTLDHASIWYKWKPEEDDEITITQGDYTTGKLYLNTVMPDGDQYRILATGVKKAAARKAWESYADTTFQRIAERCAAECGMVGRFYGIDGSLPYSYVLRQNEGCAAFLSRIGEWEGATIKAFNGAFRGISVKYAQEREPEQEMEITADQEGITYRRRENLKYVGLTIQTPYARATARDTAVRGGNAPILTHLPAMDNAQAGRWARGLLLMHNRRAEEFTIDTGLNTGLSAMARIDVTGNTDMSGKWLVDEAEHDLFNQRTTAKLLRVITTIW